MNIAIPAPVYFLNSLTAYLLRKIWRDTVGALRARIEGGDQPVFAKPAARAKIFTGRVLYNASDLYYLGAISRREPVWCSEVFWLSRLPVARRFRHFDLENGVIALAGVNIKPSERTDAGFLIDYRQSAVSGFDDQVAAVPYACWRMTDHFGVSAYSSAGFTEMSSDFSVGFQLTFYR